MSLTEWLAEGVAVIVGCVGYFSAERVLNRWARGIEHFRDVRWTRRAVMLALPVVWPAVLLVDWIDPTRSRRQAG